MKNILFLFAEKYFIFCLLKNSLSTQKQSNCKKRCSPCKKRQHEKSCEIKGGGPEVAVMVG